MVLFRPAQKSGMNTLEENNGPGGFTDIPGYIVYRITSNLYNLGYLPKTRLFTTLQKDIILFFS